jgi:hypothetical protein
MKWFEPDTRWELFSMKSLEDFIDNYVVTDKFHNQVPDDIVTAFKTVSYLMAHSYYHWPMMDEAMTKALLVMEMAVKLKAKQDNIALEIPPNKNGKPFQKKLVNLINEVCEVSSLDFLKPDFDRVRSIRNSRMHPDKHSYMGAIGKPNGNVMLFINIINFLFMEKVAIEQLTSKREKLNKELEIFKNGNFVLEHNNTKILMDIVHYHKYVKFGDRELLMLLVNPILIDVYETLTNHRFGKPLIVILKDFTINGLTLVGKDLNNGIVSIETTYKEENMMKFEAYYEELDRVSDSNKHLYFSSASQDALWEMEKVIYENCWR